MTSVEFELPDSGESIFTIADAVEGDAKYMDHDLHKYGHVRVIIAPESGPASYVLEWQALEGTFPFPWMKDACVEGVKAALAEPLPDGGRIVLVRVSIVDGSYHSTDTDAESVRTAARLAVRNGLSTAALVPL